MLCKIPDSGGKKSRGALVRLSVSFVLLIHFFFEHNFCCCYIYIRVWEFVIAFAGVAFFRVRRNLPAFQQTRFVCRTTAVNFE